MFRHQPRYADCAAKIILRWIFWTTTITRKSGAQLELNYTINQTSAQKKRRISSLKKKLDELIKKKPRQRLNLISRPNDHHRLDPNWIHAHLVPAKTHSQLSAIRAPVAVKMVSVFTQNNKKRVLNMVNPKASLSPSLLPLPLSLSRSLSLTLAMRNLLFSLATFFRGMHV